MLHSAVRINEAVLLLMEAVDILRARRRMVRSYRSPDTRLTLR